MSQPTEGNIELIIAHVALGSNVRSSTGSPQKLLEAVIAAISDDSVKVRAKSSFYSSPAFPAGSGPDYVNAAITVETSLSAHHLLAYLHRLEAKFGRVRDARWAARTMDLDLLDFGGAIVPDQQTVHQWVNLSLEAQMKKAPEQLLLPHPRIQDRAFVLIPLADIAPDWVHPMSRKRIAELLSALPEAEKEAIQPLD